MNIERILPHKSWKCDHIIMGSEEERRIGAHEKTEDSRREQWANPAEFFLTLIAFIVANGNLLRFPYLCLTNGGGAFLVAYFCCLLVCGCPIFILELVMGQSSRASCLNMWNKYGRLFKGLGYTSVLGTIVLTLYTQVYMAWILYFLWSSMTSQLPWTTCGNEWNTASCLVTVGNSSANISDSNSSYDIGSVGYVVAMKNSSSVAPGNNLTVAMDNNTVAMAGTTAVEEFFEHNVLRLSSGIEEIGSLNWRMCISHLVSWVLMIVCLAWGIKSTGKIVWVTATLPYILITVFVIRAALLPGFKDGILFYLTPNFHRLADPQVWMLAFLQIFYTLGPGWGCVSTMSSFNDYNHNFLIEGVFCPIACCLTSFYAGFATFGAVGFLAHKLGVPVEKALSTGPGIAFMTYPELAAQLPASPVWAALFFIMLVTVMIDTMIIGVETVVTALSDMLSIPKRRKFWVLIGYSVFNIVLGLLFYTQAGMYFFQLVDWYAFVLSLFLVTGMECLVCTWFYGYNRLLQDISHMIGPKPALKILIPLWGILVPALIVIAMVWSIVTLSKPRYGEYVYPTWCSYFGWGMAVFVISPSVLYPLYKVISLSGKGFCERMKRFLSVENDDGKGVENVSMLEYTDSRKA